MSGKPTDWSTARYVCPSGDPPNSQGQCTTTTVVGQSTCPPGIPLFGTTGLCAFNIITPPCPAGTHPGIFPTFCISDANGGRPNVCSSGSFNPSTQNCEITTTTPATCPPGTALSGNVCAAHPIPKGPKQT